ALTRIAEAASARRSMRVKAETAGRFREEFVAAVRHELNTPLNAILGFSQVLLDEIDGPLTAQQREDVDAICAAGLHLSDLIEAVLAEWAPDRSDTPLPLVAVDLEAVAQEVATMLRGQLAARPIVLEVRAEPDLPRPLGDRRRLRQALLNLGANALRATDAGSIVFELAHEGELVRITVRDTGTGIAAEELPRLFQEFTQVGQEERHPGGSGLGLALTRAMVEWHGGRIEVDTKLGAGSAFSILLPVPR
ncbi:MAG: HAMP domain-containing histidine kinase, partial [Sandaracinaceae bacterium]|nr:HAMP domain-containing histidine kinase [Sandaracinaceae bacterium]